VLAALQEVYPRIEDVVPEAFAQGRVTLNFREKGIKDPIPLDGISDGVLHALALLVALRQPGPGLLAIEEPENALHPWSVRRILERAQTPSRGRAQRQLLITTHSETVVNAVRDPKSLFIVESGKNGTTVVPATTKETALESILKESGQQLGDVWMGGTLGGVPEAS
jgi:predicted ATPase